MSEPAATEEADTGLHLSRHLEMALRRDREGATAWLDLRPDLLDELGHLSFGLTSFLVDSVGGLTAGIAALPLWTVTADLACWSVSAATVGPVRADATIVRRGRTTALSRVSVVDEGDGDRIVAFGEVTGAILKPDFEIPITSREIGQVFRHPPPEAARQPFREFLRLERRENAAVLDLHDELRNPWGILHGGVTGILVAEGAGIAARELLGTGVRTVVRSVVIRYLSPGRAGPIVSQAIETARVDDGVVARLEVRDEGHHDRLMATGVVTLSRHP